MKVLVVRNSDRSKNIVVATDIYISDSQLLTEGVETRFTISKLTGYNDALKSEIDLREIAYGWIEFKQMISNIGLGLYIFNPIVGEIQVIDAGGGTLDTITNLNITQSNIGDDLELTWDLSVSPGVTAYKVYRETVTIEGRVLVATLGPAEVAYTEASPSDGIEYIFDIQTVAGVEETSVIDFANNAYSITTQAALPVQSGILFSESTDEHLLTTPTIVLDNPWSVKLGIQEISTGGSGIGLFGFNSSTNHRLIAYPGSDYFRLNNAPDGLLTSPTTTNPVDFVSRKIIEIYTEAGGDVYYKDSPAATPEFLFTSPTATSFDLNSILKAGSSLKGEGYLWYIELNDNGTIETWDFSEGSGDTLTGSLGTEWTIQTPGDLTHINNNMWFADLPAPPGYVPFTSLSVGGRAMTGLLANLLADPADYTPGTVEYAIAEIYDNGGSSHNPEGYSHAYLPLLTNDIANTSLVTFATPDEYETAGLAVVQLLKSIGITPVLGTVGTFDTAVKQAAKDYDSTIGAMLSGDPLNPTPEAQWDFNTDLGGTVTAVIPLYIAKAQSIATAESILLSNVYQHFIDGQTAPDYHDWIGADGTHYNPDGYMEYGIASAATFNLLGVAPTKVCVLGDSLGNGITEQLASAYN